MHSLKKIVQDYPGRLILLSLLAAIGTGTFLLWLPISRTKPLSLIDIFFTSTSVTCVTGLLTIPLSSFTPFGQVIILILMQIGGLGLITMSIFVMSLFIEFGLGTQVLAGKLLELESWKNIKNILFFIIKLSLVTELAGALLIFMIINKEFSLSKGIFIAFFHAISSFCDAGLSLFPHGMMYYQNNYWMLAITSFLMLFGGLGFIVWHELLLSLRSWWQNKKIHLSLHTKIVLSTTSSIIIIATILFWILERSNTLHGLTPGLTIVNALFNTISSRSTGFLTVYAFDLHIATLFIIMIICFIGSSPGSTGSGIKTTTFAVYCASIRAALSGKTSVEIKGRRLGRDQILKAIAIIGLSQIWIFITVFCLLITEQRGDFLDILFECVSAFSTLGISLGLTPYLSNTGKLFIILSMLIGRIGSFTFILALRKKTEIAEYKYPEERVMLS